MLLILPDLFKKRNYNTKIKNIEDKIPNLATTAALNAKINEVKGKIPGITGLATTIAPNDVINQTLVPLLKKLTIKKIAEIQKGLDHGPSNKYVTTQ